MDEVKQVIVIRKDLKMRKGKMIAQGAHSSMKVILDKCIKTKIVKWSDKCVLKLPLNENEALYNWLNGSFTKIVVGVNSLEELEELEKEAIKNNILTAKITDAGRTEFNGVPTITALAIGPEFNDKINPITKHLTLI
jgi:peptidyl-tRNA hydrolase, PTH2 family